MLRPLPPALTSLLVVLAVTSAAPARAASCAPGDPAQQLAETGLQAYRDAVARKDDAARTRGLELAVRCYHLAQNQNPPGRAKLYHPLGLAYDRLGRDAAAATAFAAFLREIPEAERLPGVTAQINLRLAALLSRLGQLDITAPAGAALRVDDQPVGTAPLGHLVPVDPGVHVVHAAGAGLIPRSRSAAVSAGGVATVALVDPGGRAVTPRHQILRRWAGGALGAGLVLAGGGAALWALADRPTCGDPGGPVTCAQVFPPAGYGIALTALGVAAVGVSISLFVVSRRAQAQGERAQRSPTEDEANSPGTASRRVARSEAWSP